MSSLHILLMLAIVSAAPLWAAGAHAAAIAGEAAACASHKWSVEREAALLAAPKGEAGAGAEWSAEEDGGFLLELQPLANVVFEMTPERAPSGAVSFGGVVRLAAIAGGLYEISLSGEAWIDVIQNGALVKSEDFSGAKGCAIRKSVRFRLEPGAAVLQLSGAAAPSIGVVVMRVP